MEVFYARNNYGGPLYLSITERPYLFEIIKECREKDEVGGFDHFTAIIYIFIRFRIKIS